MLWVEKNGVAVAILRKSASTSIRQRIGNTPVLKGDEVLKFDTRVVFMRDPWERWCSAYTFYNYLNESHQNGAKHRIPREVTHSGYETWVDFALANPDPHWLPQLDDDNWSHIHKLDDIDKYWQDYFPATLLPDKLNRTGGHLPTNNYRRSEIETMLAKDFAQWLLL